MPHLRFRGMEKQELVQISTELLNQLEAVIECPRDYFTLEYIESIYIFDGVEDSGKWPYVEVLWFDRGEKLMDKVAQIITEFIKQYSYGDVTVNFTNLVKANYFENGQRF
ncbi:MAG: DUF1904 family protein [Proteocatella sp.]